MKHIATEVQGVLARLGIRAEWLSPLQLYSFREGIQKRFIEPNKRSLLWEGIREGVSLRNPEAWQWIASVPLAGRAVLFFDERAESSGFLFESGIDVVRVLAESTGFEFYLTDEAMSFLIAFNHHDYLSAAGAAAPWLLDLKRSAAPRS